MNGMLQITDDLAKTTELAQKGQSMVLGIQTIETGVFGGIVTGILTNILHKFNKIELPAYLGFFSGSRFVPIITAVSSIFLGVIMFLFGQQYRVGFLMPED